MISIYKKSISDTGIVAREKPEPGCWVDIVNPTEDEVSKIVADVKIDKDFIISALDPDETPRIEVEGSNVLIVLRLPLLNEEEKFITLPLGIIFTPKHLLTVSFTTTEVVDDFVNQRIKNFYTTKKTRFALQLLKRTNHYYQKFLNDIERQIEDIEKTVFKSVRNKEIKQMLGLQKSLVYINTAIIANDKVLGKIFNGKVLKLFDEDEDLLEDIIIDNKQSIEMVNIYRNILNNTMNAYASLISNNLNSRMKFLTSASIIVAIPTVVASIYGMNVELPFDWLPYPYAFLVTMMFTSILTAGAIWIFMKKKWF